MRKLVQILGFCFMCASDRNGYQIRYYDSIKATSVSWLWYPYIPYGKVTIVQGDPGEGKTTMMLQIAALLTRGKSIPDGKEPIQPSNVIFQGAEDGIADTIKPRLIAAGADCSRVAFIDTKGNEKLSLADERFEKAIRDCNAKLLIIDPMQAFMGNDVDMTKLGGIRDAFVRITDVAEETGCAVVMIGHMNKGSGSKGIYRGLGSIDVAAAARSVLLIGRDQEEPTTRVMVPIKSSLAPEGDAYSFELDPDIGFHWLGPCKYSSEEILGMNIHRGSKVERAKEHIRMMLKDNDMHGEVIQERLQKLGIGRRTVTTAKIELGVETYKNGNVWFWHLDD